MWIIHIIQKLCVNNPLLFLVYIQLSSRSESESFYPSGKALGVHKQMMHDTSLIMKDFHKEWCLRWETPPLSLAQAIFMFFLPLGSCLLAAPSWVWVWPCSLPRLSPRGSALGQLAWVCRALPVPQLRLSTEGNRLMAPRQGMKPAQLLPRWAPALRPTLTAQECVISHQDWQTSLASLCQGHFSSSPRTPYELQRSETKKKTNGVLLGIKHCPSRGLGLDSPPCPKLLVSTYAQTYWRWKLVHSFTQALGKKCRCKITPHLAQNNSFCIGNS